MNNVLIVAGKFADVALAVSNLYVLLSMRKIQNNRTLTDVLKDENADLRKENTYLTHRLRVARIKARRKKDC